MRRQSPFIDSPRLIFHGAYHKMGTVWLMRVLEQVARQWRLCLQKSNEHGDAVESETNILFANHSHLNLETLGSFVGSHMIRDPRDCVVSGYFYHLWTEEAWARQSQDRFDGLSYQQHLKSLDQEQGLAAEIRVFAGYARTYFLRDWNYADDRILEIKYEDLLADEQAVFTKLFQHYGFTERAVRQAVQLAEQCSFKKVTGRAVGQSQAQSHLRSGRPGEWKEILSESHLRLIDEQFGDLIVQMGYK